MLVFGIVAFDGNIWRGDRQHVRDFESAPSKLVTFDLQMKRLITRKLVLAIADGTVSVDGRQIYTAEDLRVGVFTSTEGF